MNFTHTAWWIFIMFVSAFGNAFFAGDALARKKKWKFTAFIAILSFILGTLDLFAAVSS